VPGDRRRILSAGAADANSDAGRPPTGPDHRSRPISREAPDRPVGPCGRVILWAMSERRLLDRFPAAVSWTDDVTVIGHGMQLSGRLTSADVIVVAGRVDGPIVSEKLVRVLPGGFVRGPIRALAVVIEGAVEGDVVVDEQIELTKSGRVRGDVIGPHVAVAEGAFLQGRLRATVGKIRRYRESRGG